MKYLLAIASLSLALAIGTAHAQQAQPYAGLQARPLKALSDEQIADLKAGRGMALALAAELNGYPGPSHVLELQQELALDEAQRTRVQNLFAAMKAETVPLGERLIAAEIALDRQFAAHTITPASLTAATESIGALQAKLRAAHLKYHLAMMGVLAPEQINRYNELRGYADSPPPAGHAPGAHRQAN